MLAYSPMGVFMASPSEGDSRAAEVEDAAIVRGPLLDANEVNNAASRLLHRGRSDLALSGFERAARVGQPNAIASLIWCRVLAGDMGGAISAFEECGPLAEAFISSQRGQALRRELRRQIPNIQSNAALAYLATGDRPAARDLWRTAGDSGHAEALFYMAALAWRDDRNDPRARELLGILDETQIQYLDGVMRESVAESSGWFREWAVECLSFLSSVSAASVGMTSGANRIREQAAEVHGMRLHIARDPSMSGDILRGLATGAGTDVQAYLATNPSTPRDVLRSLAASEDQDLRSCVAGNPATPSDILRLLATDLGTYVRVAVAANPATSADILRVMAADADADVRRGVARNTSSPTDCLQTLARDRSALVRRAVSRNSACPEGALRILSTDSDWRARLGTAENSATPSDVLRSLAVDDDSDVRQGVVGNPATPADVLRALGIADPREFPAAQQARADAPQATDNSSDEAGQANAEGMSLQATEVGGLQKRRVIQLELPGQ